MNYNIKLAPGEYHLYSPTQHNSVFVVIITKQMTNFFSLLVLESVLSYDRRKSVHLGKFFLHEEFLTPQEVILMSSKFQHMFTFQSQDKSMKLWSRQDQMKLDKKYVRVGVRSLLSSSKKFVCFLKIIWFNLCYIIINTLSFL